MHQIRFTRRAEKDLRKLNKIYLPKVSKSFEALQLNPLLGQKMSGEFDGSYRIKIPPIRIIYFPDFKNKVIWIEAIGQRQGIYKN